MKFESFLIATYNPKHFDRPRLICNDGFSMSIQGGKGLYSSPREIGYEFSSMEIGFPSEDEEILREYAEEPDNLTNTVYPYVPVSLIKAVIGKHDGINEIETLMQLVKDKKS